ncbi:hypothetical protein M0R45_030800 [Rubus argutus]|uniref:MULE transposase domain-containing protein n=1 Tax=Rubus argutus TaxID=59490 RepID=A0AAW1WEQ3_RUBAR
MMFRSLTRFNSDYVEILGQLIGATAKDANQGLYPVAFAIVDAENERNWRWFLEILAQELGRQNRRITFISDRNAGLLSALPKILEIVDGIRVKLMGMMADRREAAKSWFTELCPVMEDRLKENLNVGRHWRVSLSDTDVYVTYV